LHREASLFVLHSSPCDARSCSANHWVPIWNQRFSPRRAALNTRTFGTVPIGS